MTDHQHLAEGYGDASVPCSTKTGAIPTKDERDALRARVKALEEAGQVLVEKYEEIVLCDDAPRSLNDDAVVRFRAALEARHDQPDQGGGQ